MDEEQNSTELHPRTPNDRQAHTDTKTGDWNKRKSAKARRSSYDVTRGTVSVCARTTDTKIKEAVIVHNSCKGIASRSSEGKTTKQVYDDEQGHSKSKHKNQEKF